MFTGTSVREDHNGANLLNYASKTSGALSAPSERHLAHRRLRQHDHRKRADLVRFDPTAASATSSRLSQRIARGHVIGDAVLAQQQEFVTP